MENRRPTGLTDSARYKFGIGLVVGCYLAAHVLPAHPTPFGDGFMFGWQIYVKQHLPSSNPVAIFVAVG